MPSEQEPATAGTPLAERLEQVLENSGCVADLLGLDAKDLEALYHLGYTEYQQQKHEEAAATFGYLCRCDHRQARFWMGLGAAWQMLQNHGGASAAYAQAAACDPPDVRAPVHAAECLLALGQVEDAIDALDHAVEVSPFADDADDLLGRVGALYDAIGQFLDQAEAEENQESGADAAEPVRN